MNIISNVHKSELGIILTCDDELFAKLHLLDVISEHQTLVANIPGQELGIY
jgi:hypothetical protein